MSASSPSTGIINGAAYGLLGVGFAFILGVTGRFHFAYSFTYALAAYMVFWWSERVGVGFWLAAVLGIATATIVGVGIERIVYRPVARRAGATALLAIFVASLGIAIAGQNLLSLVFSSASQQIVLGPAALRTPIHWGPAVVPLARRLAGALGRRARRSSCRSLPAGSPRSAGRSRRPGATPRWPASSASTPTASTSSCFAIGTMLCGVAAFWFGVKYSVQPDMGFKPVIFAFVVAFLAGTASSPIRVFVVGVIDRLDRAVEHDLARGPLEPARDLRRPADLPDLAVDRTPKRIVARLRAGSA